MDGFETPQVAERRLKLELRLAQLDETQGCREDFIKFVKKMWPDFINGAHHTMIAKKFEDIATGKNKRLIINMPPRHTKSEFASYLFPSWIIGRAPKTKIIQTTHTAELAVNFGRKVRNLLDTNEYKKIFDDVQLQADSKAAGRWSTNHGGEYFASGVGGAITGRGADLLIIDDPHSEQDALSDTAMEHAYEWYTSGPRQRLQPGGAIVVVMTRWSLRDLTAKVIKAQGQDEHADKWEVVEFPAIMPSGNACWPEYWKLQELEEYVRPYLLESGTHSGNRTLLRKKGRLSRRSGGSAGSMTRFRNWSTLYRVMTRRSARRKQRTILPLPPGVYSIPSRRGPRTLFYWMQRRGGGTFPS